jgi:hypothetical protein
MAMKQRKDFENIVMNPRKGFENSHEPEKGF